MKVEPVIRNYRQSDREAVFRIAADTAFFGDPVEAMLEDRHLFCDIFYRYYTDLEPDHGWVASEEDQVVGFLMGSLNTKLQQRRLILDILPSSFWRIIHGQYRLGPKTWQFARGLIASALTGENLHPDLNHYPAHLHINIDFHWRNRGLGRRLIETYLDQLGQKEVPGVHLMTTDRNISACRLYERMGFQLLDSHPTRFWSGLVDISVEKRCYGLKLIEE